MKISIKDIARVAGVSHSTVSRALSDSPLVNVETKQRIMRLAHEMGYSPNAGARSLVIGRTYTIGVVVTTIADPFIADVVQGIETTAYGHGYTLILSSSSYDPERELAAVEMLRSKRVDGVIVTSSRVGALYHRHLQQIGVPVVLLNNHSTRGGPEMVSVRVDDRDGGYMATKHLIQLGHRRIAYVDGGPNHYSPSMGRQEGYHQALSEAGLDDDQALVLSGDGRPAGGERVLSALLDLPHPPSAVFCYNDMTAIGLLSAARKAGLAVPQDLAVVGFDDILYASLVCPPLTTVAQPKSELGQRAMEIVLALLTAQSSTDRQQITDVILRGKLVVRESSIGKSEMRR